jgi:hypothetical protein
MAKARVLYHGSPTAIAGDWLEPRPSAVIGGERAVFATDKKYVALAFMAPWRDADLGLGGYGGSDVFFEENAPGAFAEAFGGKSGWLYTVADEGFGGDPRLGMRNREFIRRTPARILTRTFVPDLAKAIRRAGMRVIKFEERMELYRKAGLLKMPSRKTGGGIVGRLLRPAELRTVQGH